MRWIDSTGKLWGKINLIDFSALLLALGLSLGVLAVQSGFHHTSGQMVKGEGEIEYVIYIRNLKTLQPNLFVPGKKLSITIRNQPRGEVAIVNVVQTPRHASFMLPNGVLKTVEDPADPYGYDYLITLKDHAQFGTEGLVTEGIKIKIGLGIEVEGHDYRVPGTIVDVKAVEAKK